MINFLETYAPHIVLGVTIIGSLSPFLRSRVVSDQNLKKVFGDVKSMASNIQFKEIDINASLSKINHITDNLKANISNLDLKLDNKIQEINQTILAFTESEIYTKMIDGLSQLNELAELLKNKDTTIQDLGATIKEIKKKLG